jgi:phosphohistidine swiveling domain-containing protein
VVYHLDIAEPTPAEDLAAVREAIGAYRDGLTGDPRERRERLERRSREVLGSARRAAEREERRGLTPPVTVPPEVRVRLLRTVQEARDVTAQDVLVIPHLTPAWPTVIARAGAVVTDVGGSLSHGSIVARELGVPAVMGTGNATKILREGQLVDVDGGRGVVALTMRQDGGR